MTFQGDPPAYFYLIPCACALLLCVLTLRKREFHQASARILILYGLFSALAYGLLYAGSSGPLTALRPDFTAHLGLYTALLLAWVLLGYTLVYLRSSNAQQAVWAGLLLLAAALIALDSNLFNLPEILWPVNGTGLYRPAATWAGVLAGFVVLNLSALLLTLLRLRQTAQPLHRNRLQHLIPIHVVFALGGAAFFLNIPAAGCAAQLAAGAFMLQAALTLQLPDLRRLTRRLFTDGVVVIIFAGLFTGGFLALEAAFGSLSSYRPMWAGAVLAAALAALYRPTALFAGKLTQRLLPASNYQPALIVQSYAAAISNIVDMDLLAAAAVGMVRETLGIHRGHLLLVEKQETGQETGYRLRDVPIPGEETLVPVLLCFDGPIAAAFVREHRPLTQYEMDLLPELCQSPAGELAWFSGTGLDVYLPVIVQDEWIGLLAFGPKAKRDRYNENDLLLLSALASQTGASLHNARLVQNLRELNEQLTSAYAALNVVHQQLERLDRTKTDFINIASHELRTPLTLLLGYAEMLSDDEHLMNDPFYSQMISGVETGTHRLHEIVSSMLDMAKIDSRALDLTPKAISLPALVRDIQVSLSKAMQERHLRFEMVELTNLPLIEADPDALQKVFSNLLENAVKFTPDGGQITVSQCMLPAQESPLGRDSVEVTVCDTGIGIDKDMLELIFVKFYHSGPVDLHSTGKTKFKGGGPGLGLAIVRGIVEAHNGRVWVESAGCNEQTFPGSQFHVLLPLSQKTYREPATIPLERRQPASVAA